MKISVNFFYVQDMIITENVFLHELLIGYNFIEQFCTTEYTLRVTYRCRTATNFKDYKNCISVTYYVILQSSDYLL